MRIGANTLQDANFEAVEAGIKDSAAVEDVSSEVTVRSEFIAREPVTTLEDFYARQSELDAEYARLLGVDPAFVYVESTARMQFGKVFVTYDVTFIQPAGEGGAAGILKSNAIRATEIGSISSTLFRTDEEPDIVLYVDATMPPLAETVTDEEGWRKQRAALSDMACEEGRCEILCSSQAVNFEVQEVVTYVAFGKDEAGTRSDMCRTRILPPPPVPSPPLSPPPPSPPPPAPPSPSSPPRPPPSRRLPLPSRTSARRSAIGTQTIAGAAPAALVVLLLLWLRHMKRRGGDSEGKHGGASLQGLPDNRADLGCVEDAENAAQHLDEDMHERLRGDSADIAILIESEPAISISSELSAKPSTAEPPAEFPTEPAAESAGAEPAAAPADDSTQLSAVEPAAEPADTELSLAEPAAEPAAEPRIEPAAEQGAAEPDAQPAAKQTAALVES